MVNKFGLKLGQTVWLTRLPASRKEVTERSFEGTVVNCEDMMVLVQFEGDNFEWVHPTQDNTFLFNVVDPR
jgi:hypothetical protein